MDFWKSVSGMMKLELGSGDIGTALSAINQQNIPIFYANCVNELTARFYIHRKDYEKVRILCEKRGDRLRLLGYRGLYWPLRRTVHRPVLFWGLCIILALAMYIPTRVFFVRVEGNVQISTRLILSAAEDCGICFGTSRREVRSEKVKNALLSAVPQLQWACVNTSGCIATISVREGTELSPQEEKPEVGSIVASRDGIVDSCTVINGNLTVSPGQAVKEGQLLISGYTDCGLFIQATRAEGEIFAQTQHRLSSVMPMQCQNKACSGEETRIYSLLIGKKRINLWNNSRIWDTTYDRMYKEYILSLPGGFRLPVALCVERYISCDITEVKMQEEVAQTELAAFADAYLTQHMVAGNILQQIDSFFFEEGSYRLEGRYTCREMIGRLQPEKIGEGNGKND